ncbi:MAG TPA: copper amine oxidase N-terminal domain-containing protein, partial [Candidatus Paceibacterota bacterium]|nr:copper amine oxidase N-terminal domain-containing protein [Candidatus Paceibacterota bacterium]
SRGQKLVLTIGKNTAALNGKVVSIDSDPRVVPTITNGRTLLPLRFVAEAFGFQVDWNAQARSIVLTYGGGS